MACLALSLQPLNGPDVLLQTREWFPPARAALASHSFRTTRGTSVNGKSESMDKQTIGLGDDPLSAKSGQVVVGKESKYRIVYRLVNAIYVLGITTADKDVSNNVFECASTVNQAVSVLVAACKGIDVTADKLLRKYTEVYMALDVVLRGVSAARLATILASFHGEGIAQIVVLATDAENRVRGAENWNQVKGHSIERLNNIEVLSNATFELPEETLRAGDEAAALLGSQPQTSTAGSNVTPKPEEQPAPNADPFAASDAINKPDELAGGFKKNKEAPKDVTAGLAELTVPTLGEGAEGLKGVEGFEGEYEDLDYGDDAGGFGDAFEGLTDAFGGGLDPSEFGATTKKPQDSGLGGLEELEGGGKKVNGISQIASTKAKDSNQLLGIDTTEGGTLHRDKLVSSKGPVLWLTEEIHAEFQGSALIRVGLQGSLQMRTVPSSLSKADTQFSFGLDGAAGIRRAVVRSSVASSLGNGLFHVRSAPSDSAVTILKYRLQPQFTPVPLRVRLVTRKIDSLLSIMVQYVANPFLPGILKDVVFIVSLPFTPSTLKMSPRGTMDRFSRELRWQIPQVNLQAPPQRLRAQLPVASEAIPDIFSDSSPATEIDTKTKLKVRVEFACGGESLSGISIIPASKGTSEFFIGEHVFKAGKFLCS